MIRYIKFINFFTKLEIRDNLKTKKYVLNKSFDRFIENINDQKIQIESKKLKNRIK